MTRIHVTDRANFKTCRRAFKFDVLDRRQLKSDTKTGPLWVGSMGHLALADLYRSGTIPSVTLEAEIRKWESDNKFKAPKETIDLLMGVCSNYHRLIYPLDMAQNWEILTIEEELAFPVPDTDGILVGTMDIAFRHRGAIWGLDHKFYAEMPALSRLEVDDQMTAYTWLLSQRFPGEKIGGMFHNVIKKKLPAIPMRLKAGDKLSKDKSVDTLYEIYYDAIKSNGFNPDDYAEILATLQKKGHSSFFLRHLVPRGKRELDIWAENLKYEMRDILNPETRMYPNPSWECDRCDFLVPCKMLQEGSNVDLILDTLYEPKVGRD